MDVDTLWLSVLNCYVILNKSLLKHLFVIFLVSLLDQTPILRTYRALDKREYLMIIFLISQ